MDRLRLFGRSGQAEEIAIRLGGTFAVAERWTVPARGRMSQLGAFDPGCGALYVSDGWGIAYAAIRFRRLDAITGQETAAFRSGTAVRCFALGPGRDELIAATDSKLFRLDATTLEERQRWDTRIPRYSNTLAIRGDQVVVANWRDPKVGVVDLATGRVRRRAAPAMTIVLDGPGDPLLVGGLDGGVDAIDPVTGGVRRVVDTPAALDAALSPDRRTLWLTIGVRAHLTSRSVRRGAPTRILHGYGLDDSGGPGRFRVPLPVRRVAAGETRLWLAGEQEILSVPLPVGLHPARIWKLPNGHEILALDPDTGLVVTTMDDAKARSALLSCFRAED
jgi:hypothetical protein